MHVHMHEKGRQASYGNSVKLSLSSSAIDPRVFWHCHWLPPPELISLIRVQYILFLHRKTEQGLADSKRRGEKCWMTAWIHEWMDRWMGMRGFMGPLPPLQPEKKSQGQERRARFWARWRISTPAFSDTARNQDKPGGRGSFTFYWFPSLWISQHLANIGDSLKKSSACKANEIMLPKTVSDLEKHHKPHSLGLAAKNGRMSRR